MKNKAHLGINIDLLNNEKYATLNNDQRMLYSLYAERVQCSEYNAKMGDKRFSDAKGRVFCIFTDEEAARLMHVSTKSIQRWRKGLIEIGLVESIAVRHALMRVNHIYVNEVEEAPEGADVPLKWKNHKVEVIKEQTLSSWTTKAKMVWTNRLKGTGQIAVSPSGQSVQDDQPKSPLSLPQASLTQDNNKTEQDARTRARDVNGYQDQPASRVNKGYWALPAAVRVAFNRAHGFINGYMADQLGQLVAEFGVDCTVYAITKSAGRKISYPLRYIQRTLAVAKQRNGSNAAAVTVEDMVHFDRDYFANRQHHWNAEEFDRRFSDFVDRQGLLGKYRPTVKARVVNRPQVPTIPMFKLAQEMTGSTVSASTLGY